MRIPMSAKDQLLLARQHGHELSIETRGEKSWLLCTCGYRSTARRSRKALNSTMAWHLGKVIADHLDGAQPPPSVVPQPAPEPDTAHQERGARAPSTESATA